MLRCHGEDPLLNDLAPKKGTAFTEEKRQRFGLEGLLAPSTESLEPTS
jgi:hypothetical protein